jgi:hypothetical protein
VHGRRVLVAEVRQLVLDERVRDLGDRHRPIVSVAQATYVV